MLVILVLALVVIAPVLVIGRNVAGGACGCWHVEEREVALVLDGRR